MNIRIDNGVDNTVGDASSLDFIQLHIRPIETTIFHREINALWCQDLKKLKQFRI